MGDDGRITDVSVHPYAPVGCESLEVYILSKSLLLSLVDNCAAHNIPSFSQGRGFTFANISAHDMMWVLHEAVDLYHNNPKAWRGLMHAGMTADFSWNKSAGEYLEIYGWITGK